MGRLRRAGMENCAPKRNEKSDKGEWRSDTGAPWRKRANQKPKGENIAYDKLVQA